MNKYPIPLYLNQKFVFDILAMMEGGFTQLETIKSTQTEREDKSNKISGGLGLSNVFGLIGVSMGGEKKSSGQKGEDQEIIKQKVHTPNSLFGRMRERLTGQQLIKTSDYLQTEPGQFIELKLTLRKNPLIDAFGTFKTIMELALVFEEPTQKHGKQKSQKNENKRVLKQMNAMIEQLNSEGTFDLIGRNLVSEKIDIVLTIDRAFLSDPSFSDLLDGEYTVLGKITKVIKNDDNDKIDLLRKTSLNRVSGLMLQTLKDCFKPGSIEGIDIPEIITEIKGPAIQILPIAIFA